MGWIAVVVVLVLLVGLGLLVRGRPDPSSLLQARDRRDLGGLHGGTGNRPSM